ncbi:MAG: TolC family protein [Pseudomonadota bacterium]
MKYFMSVAVQAVFFWGGSVFAMAPLVHAQSAAPPTPLPALIAEGWQSNQELAGLRESIDALKDSAVAAGAFDDPRLGIALLNVPTDSFNLRQEAMTQKQLTLAQKLPWFGTLDLKSRRVVLQAVAQESMLAAKRNELARKITDAYWELAFIDRSLAVNARLTEMVGQLLKIAETRYGVGKGLQQDVLQGQVELSKLLDEELTLTKRRQVTESAINALINRPDYQPIQPEDTAALPDAGAIDKATLHDRVIAGNPLIEARRVAIDEAAAGIELAEKDYYPDVNVQMAYGQRDADPSGRSRSDFVSAGVVVSVPLWSKGKQDRQLSAAKKRQEAARRAYAALTESLPYRAEAMVDEMLALMKNYRLTKDAMIVQAGQWAQSALAAYEVGKIEFSTMMGAQIRLLQMDLRQDNYRYSLLRKHAELQEILGGVVDGVSAGKHVDSRQRSDDAADAHTRVARR